MNSRRLLIAAVLLLGLSGLVWWAKKHPTAAAPDSNAPSSPQVVNVLAGNVRQVDIQRKDAPPVTLKRNGVKWEITAPQPLPADQDAVSSLLSNFAPLTADSLVEEHPTNPAQFGFAPPSLVVKLQQKNGTTDELQIGGDVPVGSLVYARMGSAGKIYAIASSTKTALDKTVEDLRDKRLLTFDSNKVKTVELASTKGDFVFQKNASGDWQIVKPEAYRADNFQVEDLVKKLGEAKMTDTAGAADGFAMGTRVATAKVTDDSGVQTLEIRKNKEDYYARSNAVKGTWKVNTDVGAAVAKTLDDFRNKKLYDFAFSDPSRVDIAQNGSTATYLRSGTDWKLNGQKMDAGKMQSLIDKLRDLTATKISNSPFPATTFSITVVSKGTERVDFAKTSTGYLAKRENNPAVYEMDPSGIDDLQKTSADLKGNGSPKH